MFQNRKLLGGIQDLSMEMRARLISMEASSTDQVDNLKQDITQRFTKLKDEQRDTKVELREEMKVLNKEVKAKLKQLQSKEIAGVFLDTIYK